LITEATAEVVASWTWRLTVASGGQKPAAALSGRGAFVVLGPGVAPRPATQPT